MTSREHQGQIEAARRVLGTPPPNKNLMASATSPTPSPSPEPGEARGLGISTQRQRAHEYPLTKIATPPNHAEKQWYECPRCKTTFSEAHPTVMGNAKPCEPAQSEPGEGERGQADEYRTPPAPGNVTGCAGSVSVAGAATHASDAPSKPGEAREDEWPSVVCAVRSKRHGIEVTVPSESARRLWTLGYEVREYVPREPAQPESTAEDRERVRGIMRTRGFQQAVGLGEGTASLLRVLADAESFARTPGGQAEGVRVIKQMTQLIRRAENEMDLCEDEGDDSAWDRAREALNDAVSLSMRHRLPAPTPQAKGEAQ